MEHLHGILILALVVLLGAMSPGADFMVVMRHALAARRQGILAALGIASATLLWSTASIFGIHVLLQSAPWVDTVLRIAGAAYLALLGLKTLRLARRDIAIDASAMPSTGSGPTKQAFLVGITNPKAIVFFGSLFVSFIPASTALRVQMALPVLVFLIVAGWFTFVAIAFSTLVVRQTYTRVRPFADCVLGLVLLGLAARLAIMQ